MESLIVSKWIFCKEKYTFEVGGKNKGFEQIKDIHSSYVTSDDLEVGIGNKIALWIFVLIVIVIIEDKSARSNPS